MPFFYAFTSKTTTKTNLTKTVEASVEPPKSDSTTLFLAFLNPSDTKFIQESMKLTKKSISIIPIKDTATVRRMIKREKDTHEKISRERDIIFGKRDFNVRLNEITKLIDLIPENGFLGITFGIKKVGGRYKRLSLGLLSMDEKYNIQKDNIIKLNNFELADTSSFKEVKQKLYAKGYTEYATDKGSKNQYVLFEKSASKAFFSDYKTLFINNKVNINMIYDNKAGSIGFPNVLFSNVENLSTVRSFKNLPNDSFVFGNEGGTCCPPY